MSSFTAAVSDFVKAVPARVNAVVANSAQEVFSIAQTPRREGGLMPVVTGFLRNTGVIAINADPVGPKTASEGSQPYTDARIEATIAGYKGGDIIQFGWSAVYARKMEERYGFANSAAMRWDSIVEKNAKRIEQALS